MRAIRITFAVALFATFAALTANAQPAGRPATQPSPRPAAPAPATPQPTQGGATLAEGKFAIVDADAFADPKQGIQRLVAAFQVVEREFKPRRDEIQQLKTRYDALVKQISDTQKVAQPQSLAALSDQAESLKVEIERKQQDGQRAIEKRAQELIEPIQQDIGNALRSFARSRGISVVFDLSKLGNVIMVVNDNDPIDITGAFIADYNRRNPASTAAATTPGNQ